MFMRFVTVCVAALFVLIAPAHAHPAPELEDRDVWSPRITYPTAKSVWKTGTWEFVRW